MCKMKSTAYCQHMVATSSSSSEDNVSLSANLGEAPAPTRDPASSSMVPQHRGGVPSQRGQFTRKYEAYWKDDLSM
jgi:hypothetical protein